MSEPKDALIFLFPLASASHQKIQNHDIDGSKLPFMHLSLCRWPYPLAAGLQFEDVS